jgi:hypothetical protein
MRAGTVDGGLLALRVGALLVTILLLVMRTTGAGLTFAGHPSGTWIFLLVAPLTAMVALGVRFRFTAATLSVIWFWSAVAGAIWGQRFDLYPVRGVELAILFAGLALTGAGRYVLLSGRGTSSSVARQSTA